MMVENLFIRQRIEQAEEYLAPYASKSKFSKGRLKFEELCPLRTVFQRDRDRIIHSNAFRRLKHKTQVFIAPSGDHYVTRLTHTLEVAQIARTISRALNLNEDLTEAIALGHDLGHTPFGHLGEEILNRLCPVGFRHNEQSLRVVDILEKCGNGLNLTHEVRDGILHHSKGDIDILGNGWTDVCTIEGQVVKIADIVAYVNHDIGDAIRGSVLTEDQLPESVISVLGYSSSQRINTLVTDIVKFTAESAISVKGNDIIVRMSPPILKATNKLREFLFDRVYNSKLATGDKDKASEVVYNLFYYLLRHPENLPEEYNQSSDIIEQKITDYIAGMTDQFAVRLAGQICAKKYVFTNLLL